jgi:MerR family copper efflux transcriptional regulator
MSTLTIGKLAKSCNVKVDTIRYYETKGLIAPSERTESDCRLYTQESVKRLRFIRKAQSLGFSLDEIKELLEIGQTPEKDCGDIQEKANKKIIEIETRITDLVAIKNSLRELAKACPGKGKPLNKCNVLKYFYGGN